MFVLVLQSQSPANTSSSLSLFLSLSFALFHSFPLSHSTLNHFTCFCSASLFIFPLNLFLFLLLLSFTIITIYFPYNLFVSFFTLFFRLSIFYRKKRIKKDFVVATSKCNEMLSLPSMHKFVRFKLIIFLLYWILLNRIIFCESSDNTIPIQKRRISKTQ